eukprot:m.47976 g.47976  ORF g.47976 m.47976 type:complete len:256 (-) comp7369_c0_seq4:90-857(-)
MRSTISLLTMRRPLKRYAPSRSHSNAKLWISQKIDSTYLEPAYLLMWSSTYHLLSLMHSLSRLRKARFYQFIQCFSIKALMIFKPHQMLSMLESYCNKMRAELLTRIAEAQAENTSESKLIEAELQRREQEISSLLGVVGGDVLSFGSKTLNLLLSMQSITKAVNGLTVISCKSGKDRTAMLVTLHQVCELVRAHNLSFVKLRDMLDQMRLSGVRMENIVKNTRKAKYAFSKEQVQDHLPILLQPPEGSYGKNIT